MFEGVLLIGADEAKLEAVRQEFPGRTLEAGVDPLAVGEALSRLTLGGIQRVYPLEAWNLTTAELTLLIKERSGGAMARSGDALRLIRTTEERHGLVLVNTGDGKGKSTAAIGMALRALGHGMRVLILQFLKGSRSYGELVLNETFGDRIEILPLGEGFTWEVKDERNRMLALDAWTRCDRAISSGEYDLVICDEINIALAKGFLPLEPVLATLKQRPPEVHVVMTGRNAPQGLIEAADLVTEMRLEKHPYKRGIKAQPGIEF
jgi:cob(I)alamin adenosyltransferase